MLTTATERARLVARLRAAGCVYAEDEARLLAESASGIDELNRMLAQRADGMPVEHVVGFAEFAGVRVAVDPGVFVPRQRTEFLVDLATRVLAPGGTLVDLCCGSGALGLVLARRVPNVAVYAADADPDAVRCARRNLAPVSGQIYQGDLFTPLPSVLRGRVDVVVANVPYVPTAEIALLPTEARQHEPRIALDGGVDGLDVLRRVAGAVTGWLRTGGYLFVETSHAQAAAARKAMHDNGLRVRVRTAEGLGATVVRGMCR